MNHLRLTIIHGKHLRLTGIDPVLAICLQELPAILELRGKPEAHVRLFPAPTSNDAATNSEWTETIEPELRHLFVSAGETLGRDLTQLRTSPRHADQKFLTFPLAHLPAWMNAVNQARLILAAVTGLDEIDMNVPYPTLDARKAAAVVRIDVLAMLLERFVRCHNPRKRR